LMSSLEPKLDDQSVSIRRYLWSSAPSFIEIKTTHRVVWKSACYYMVKIKIRHSTCWIAARDDESLRWEKKKLVLIQSLGLRISEVWDSYLAWSLAWGIS
jgi:hypothetical protein